MDSNDFRQTDLRDAVGLVRLWQAGRTQDAGAYLSPFSAAERQRLILSLLVIIDGLDSKAAKRVGRDAFLVALAEGEWDLP